MFENDDQSDEDEEESFLFILLIFNRHQHPIIRELIIMTRDD
jgi:hypothetical protein